MPFSADQGFAPLLCHSAPYLSLVVLYRDRLAGRSKVLDKTEGVHRYHFGPGRVAERGGPLDRRGAVG